MKSLVIYFLSFLIPCFGIAQDFADAKETETREYRIVAELTHSSELVSTSNQVTFYKDAELHLPNAFSPDKDGINDYFGPSGVNFAQYELKVFNRYGSLLFSSNESQNRWDGTFQGQTVEEGTYVYILNAKDLASGKSIEKQGTINVLL